MPDNVVETGKVIGWWGHLLSIDQPAVLTLCAGVAVALLTYLVAYRKTIGAQELRIKAANKELITAVLRRVAVERQLMQERQFAQVRSAKAYMAGVISDRLVKFKDALWIVLSDTIENDFLDQASKKSIIALIEQSEETIAEGETIAIQTIQPSHSKAVMVSITIYSLIAGVFATGIIAFFNISKEADVKSAGYVTVFVGVLFLITITSMLFSNKNIFSSKITRQS